MKNKFYDLLIFIIGVFFFYYLSRNVLPENLSNIQKRQFIRWGVIGLLFGSLIVYVIGGFIYKKWKAKKKE